MNKTGLYYAVFDITLDKQTKGFSSQYLKELENCKINKEDGFKIVEQLLSYVDSEIIRNKEDITYKKNTLVDLVARIYRHTSKKEKGIIKDWQKRSLEESEKIASHIFKKKYTKEQKIIEEFLNSNKEQIVSFQNELKVSSKKRVQTYEPRNSSGYYYNSGEHRIFNTIPSWVPSNNRPSKDRDYINSFYY